MLAIAETQQQIARQSNNVIMVVEEHLDVPDEYRIGKAQQ
jgi:hypothetical protein